MNSKKYVVATLISLIIILITFSIMVVIIDPFFHYRKPVLPYILNLEWYQNDGIVKHFNYDAIITGTSMVENFKNSEFDKLWNVNSVKVPYAGAMFKEINDLLITATNYNKEIKIVLRCLDLYKINEPKEKVAYDKTLYPYYLYDDNNINDIYYLLNKNAITNSITSIIYTLKKQKETSFDEYASWYNKYLFSKENVLKSYRRLPKQAIYNTSENDYQNTQENINQNVIDLAIKYPDTKFYLFYPPYSIYYWDNLNQTGVLNMQIDCIEYATKILLEYSNIYLFSFLDEYDIINNLDNYKDIRHYNEKINSLMLNKMKNNNNLITKTNYKTKMNELRNYYNTYNYDNLFKKNEFK